MLLRALRTGEPMYIIIAVLAAAFLVFCVIPLHEFAHAWAADRQGDDTPRNSGRLTLSPMAHVDPIGGILIALIGFGWGKPTPVNPRNFRNQRWGEVLVAAAGPASNLLLGWLFLFIEAVVMHISAIQGSILQMSIATFFEYSATISIFLGVLNLLPIPMFDGWHILEGFLPNGSKAREWVWRNQRTLYIVIIVLLFTGILSYPVSALSEFVIRFFSWLSALPFGG